MEFKTNEEVGDSTPPPKLLTPITSEVIYYVSCLSMQGSTNYTALLPGAIETSVGAKCSL